MRLTDIVATSVAELRDPTAALALTYAERIDESTHVGLGLAAALDQLRIAAAIADETGSTDRPDDTNMRAYRKVAAALSAVTVTSDLGPKLLTTLDALILTPKAIAAASQAVGKPTGPAASTKQRLKDRHVGRSHLRSVG